MTVKEFVSLDLAGQMFRLVDADRQGYMSCPKTIIEADKNVVRVRFGERIVVGFENASKKTMILYVKENA